mmetsp:Transcript_41382/g.103938  ORF Transcript_41382/g.103938 Transcript_41382/m.103938 type:complete len:217 (-) Transcript_41382:154-804(-)
MCRHHVVGKTHSAFASELGGHLLPIEDLVRVRAVCHVLAGQDHMCAQLPVLQARSCSHNSDTIGGTTISINRAQEDMLDLSELHPEAGDFHLCILSTADFQQAATANTAEITSPEKALPCPRVCDELQLCALRIVVVATCNADATYVDHAHNPWRHTLQRGVIQDVHGLIPHWYSVRHRGPPKRHRAISRQSILIRPDGSLRCTTHAHNLKRSCRV